MADKKRAPMNRTLTLSNEEREIYAASLRQLHAPAAKEHAIVAPLPRRTTTKSVIFSSNRNDWSKHPRCLKRAERRYC